MTGAPVRQREFFNCECEPSNQTGSRASIFRLIFTFFFNLFSYSSVACRWWNEQHVHMIQYDHPHVIRCNVSRCRQSARMYTQRTGCYATTKQWNVCTHGKANRKFYGIVFHFTRIKCVPVCASARDRECRRACKGQNVQDYLRTEYLESFFFLSECNSLFGVFGIACDRNAEPDSHAKFTPIYGAHCIYQFINSIYGIT